MLTRLISDSVASMGFEGSLKVVHFKEERNVEDLTLTISEFSIFKIS